MYLIGLCGKSGSGKTKVSKFLSDCGVYIIDADAVCKKLYKTDKNCICELENRFGPDIVTNNEINRKLLAERAFKDRESLESLNKISHKYIIDAVLKDSNTAVKNGKTYVLVDAPTLYESGLNTFCNATIAVISDKSAMYSRLVARENITQDVFLKRIQAQKSNKFLVRHSDAVIINNKNLKELRHSSLIAMLIVQLKLGAFVNRKKGKRYACKL